MFNAGLQPQVEHLHPPVKFPVSARTPMIQSLVEWDHSVKWHVVNFHGRVIKKKKLTWQSQKKIVSTHSLTLQTPSKAGEISIDVDIDSNEYSILKTNRIDDLPALPYSAYLVRF